MRYKNPLMSRLDSAKSYFSTHYKKKSLVIHTNTNTNKGTKSSILQYIVRGKKKKFKFFMSNAFKKRIKKKKNINTRNTDVYFLRNKFFFYRLKTRKKKVKKFFKFNLSSFLANNDSLSKKFASTYLVGSETKFKKKTKYLNLFIDTTTNIINIVENKNFFKPRARGQFWV